MSNNNYPPGVSGMEPQIVGYDEDDRVAAEIDEEEARDVLKSIVQYLNNADDMCDYALHVGWNSEDWRTDFAALQKKVKRLRQQVGLLCIKARHKEPVE